MAYPTSIDSFTGFTSSHTLAADAHASQHNAEQAAIVALENKIGTGASTSQNNVVLRGNGTGTSGWDSVHLAADVSGILPTQNGGNGTNSTTGSGAAVFGTSPTLITPVINAPTGTWIQTVYPIGCIYIETTGTNPSVTFGFGTWVAFGAGQTLIGVGTSDQSFAAGATGGESNHTLTTNEMPAHTHPISGNTNSAGTTGHQGNSGAQNPDNVQGPTQSAGGGAAHNNLPPYIVTYFWKRTA